MLSSSSNERAIVSSSSSPLKNPPLSSSVSSGISTSFETAAAAAAAATPATPATPVATAGSCLISSRFVLSLFISSLRLESSETICWRSELSTVVLFSSAAAGSETTCSSSSLFSVSDLISFTTGAVAVFSSPTERS